MLVKNIEVAHERKMTKYDTLRMNIEMKGWKCKVLQVEMGCRGYAYRTLIAYLCQIGLSVAEIGKKNQFGTHRIISNKAQYNC